MYQVVISWKNLRKLKIKVHINLNSLLLDWNFCIYLCIHIVGKLIFYLLLSIILLVSCKIWFNHIYSTKNCACRCLVPGKQTAMSTNWCCSAWLLERWSDRRTCCLEHFCAVDWFSWDRLLYPASGWLA